MLADIVITPWHWAGFIVCILVFLALDLGLFHRRAHIVRFKEALAWTVSHFRSSPLKSAPDEASTSSCLHEPDTLMSAPLDTDAAPRTARSIRGRLCSNPQ